MSVSGAVNGDHDAALVVSNLTYAFSGRAPVIKNFSLSLPRGSRCLLCGANGAGARGRWGAGGGISGRKGGCGRRQAAWHPVCGEGGAGPAGGALRAAAASASCGHSGALLSQWQTIPLPLRLRPGSQARRRCSRS